MKKIALMLAVVLLLLGLAGCAGTENKSENQSVTVGTEAAET